MSISKDLLLSILAMVSYNQGYGRGLQHDETQIGSATVGLQSDIATEGEAQAAGFYAVAYDTGEGVDELSNGSTVISYRGTDNIAQGPAVP